MTPATVLALKAHPEPRRVRPDLPLLRAIVSGGQIGTDHAGVWAGRALGLATGGFAPKGWRTLRGSDHSLGTDFGLVESPWDYTGRTKANVRNSDATIRIAADFLSPGERCTLSAIRKFGKPRLDVEVNFRLGFHGLRCVYADGFSDLHLAAIPCGELLRQFLVLHEVKILNIAGNARGDVGVAAEAFLVEALSGGTP